MSVSSVFLYVMFFFFKQKTAYEMRISDWSSDVCSSDLLGGDEAGVYADHAGLQRLADAPDAAHVAGVEVGGEAELGVVGERDGLLLGLEAEQRRDRAEGFLAGHLHLRGHVGQHGRLVEGPATLVAGAAEHHLRALRLGIGDVLFDLVERRRVDQRDRKSKRLNSSH